jgi:threonyl-tRNA synthetase
LIQISYLSLIFTLLPYRARITALNEPYKLEILNGIKTEPITIYHVGDQWWDLCAGPHVESTGKLDPRGIELQSIAGAYWRGDEKNAMLQVRGSTTYLSRQSKLKMFEFFS